MKMRQWCYLVMILLNLRECLGFFKYHEALRKHNLINEELSIANSFILHCGYSKGICLDSAACPWGLIMTDESEWCTQHSKSYVCCRVARVRSPINLFLAYD